MTHMISFYLNYLFTGPISNTARYSEVLGVRMQHEFGEEVVVANSVHNITDGYIMNIMNIMVFSIKKKFYLFMAALGLVAAHTGLLQLQRAGTTL